MEEVEGTHHFSCQNSQYDVLFSPLPNIIFLEEISIWKTKHHVMVQDLPKFWWGCHFWTTAPSHVKRWHCDHNGLLFSFSIGCVTVGEDRGEGRGRASGGDNSGLRWGGTKTSRYGYYMSFSNKFSLFWVYLDSSPLKSYMRNYLVVLRKMRAKLNSQTSTIEQAMFDWAHTWRRRGCTCISSRQDSKATCPHIRSFRPLSFLFCSSAPFFCPSPWPYFRLPDLSYFFRGCTSCIRPIFLCWEVDHLQLEADCLEADGLQQVKFAVARSEPEVCLICSKGPWPGQILLHLCAFCHPWGTGRFLLPVSSPTAQESKTTASDPLVPKPEGAHQSRRAPPHQLPSPRRQQYPLGWHLCTLTLMMPSSDFAEIHSCPYGLT